MHNLEYLITKTDQLENIYEPRSQPIVINNFLLTGEAFKESSAVAEWSGVPIARGIGEAGPDQEADADGDAEQFHGSDEATAA